jgi:site-specific DNA-methyltransferase (adenine-specific)
MTDTASVTTAYSDERVTLLHGDCIAAMRELPDDSVDSIVCDPPYGLGFMGKAWDDLPPGLPWAQECLRVLKPGGHLLAFGGSRTWHRLAVAVEDAGFEIRDSIAWLYGSGFPKSLNVSKAIDDIVPLSTELLPDEARFCAWVRDESGLSEPDCSRLFTSARFLTGKVEIVNTATKSSPSMGRRAMVPTAKAWAAALSELPEVPDWVSALVKSPPKPAMQTPSEWKAGKGEGVSGSNEWAGWGTALKPAFEPVVVGRKPLAAKTVAANVLLYGTGALNIDASRITGEADRPLRVNAGRADLRGDGYGTKFGSAAVGVTSQGRWPANVILDESQAAVLDTQSGITVSGSRKAGQHELMGYSGADVKPMPEVNGDSGGASRFFYCAKAPKSERPTVDGIAHPTVKPLSLMRYLVKLVTPPGGTVLEPFAGSGATVEAALLEGFNVIAVEREADYLPLILSRVDRFSTSVTAAEFDAWLLSVQELPL